MEGTNKLTKKVGRDDEDTPLEQVVMLVKSQLARRDILVTDVEVFEFVKKKVKFKEIKGGFILKDKKFLMDQIHGVPVASEEGDEQPQFPPQFAGLQPHEIMMQQRPQAMGMSTGIQANPNPPNRPQVTDNGVPMAMHPQRFEVFDPDPLQMAKIQGRFKLTPGNRYPIFREWRDVGNLTHYLIKDDRNLETQVSAEYFVAQGKGLIGGSFDADPLDRQVNRSLTFQGQFLEDRGVPVSGSNRSIPLDSEEIPAEFMKMPDISNLRGRV